MKILALDLGKYKTVGCAYESGPLLKNLRLSDCKRRFPFATQADSPKSPRSL